QSAMIIVGLQRFQRVVGTEHAAAAGAQHVPAEIEQPEPRSMQEAGDHLLFVEAGPPREIKRIDPVEFAIGAVLDQPRDCIRDSRIGGMLQNRDRGLDVTHGVRSNGSAGTLKQVPPTTGLMLTSTAITISCGGIGKPTPPAPPLCTTGVTAER